MHDRKKEVPGFTAASLTDVILSLMPSSPAPGYLGSKIWTSWTSGSDLESGGLMGTQVEHLIIALPNTG